MLKAVIVDLRYAFVGIAASAVSAFAFSAEAGTLELVKQRGVLHCGVSEGLFGFSEQNAQGQWIGFDVDFCRAVAGAIFDDRTKVSFVPLSASERFDALRAGRVDLLSRNGSPSDDEIRHALRGNLCRCTGYTGIVESVRAVGATT